MSGPVTGSLQASCDDLQSVWVQGKAQASCPQQLVDCVAPRLDGVSRAVGVVILLYRLDGHLHMNFCLCKFDCPPMLGFPRLRTETVTGRSFLLSFDFPCLKLLSFLTLTLFLKEVEDGNLKGAN